MRIDQGVLDLLNLKFVRRDGDSTVGGNIKPKNTETYDLGSTNRRYDTIYAREMIADSFTPTGASGYAPSSSQFVTLATDPDLSNERVLTAGDGIGIVDGGAGSTVTINVDVTDFIDTAYGLTEDTNNIRINAGDGLAFDTGALVVDVTAIIDTAYGLTEDTNNIRVNIGDGLDFSAGAIVIDVTDIIDTAAGLTEASNNIQLNLYAGGGLDFYTGALGVDVTDFIDTSYGLTESANDIRINAGDGLTFDTGALVINVSDFAGDGLTTSGGDLVLGTPSTLTVSTTNAVTTTSHTHEVTTSSDPTGASILASDSGGRLGLEGLGIGQAPSTSYGSIINVSGKTSAAYYGHTSQAPFGTVYSAYYSLLFDGASSPGGIVAYYKYSFTGSDTAISGPTLGSFNGSISNGLTPTIGGDTRGLYVAFDFEDASVTDGFFGLQIIPSVDTGTVSGDSYGIIVSDFAVGTGSVAEYTGLYILDIVNATTSYAIYTGAGQVRFGDDLVLAYDASNYSTFSVDASGTMTVAPTGDYIFDPAGLDVRPATGYELNLGSISKKWLTLHAAELWVETLVAQNTIATIGGRILVGPTTKFTDTVLSADTYTNEFANNSFETAGAGGSDVFSDWGESAGTGAITQDATVYYDGSYSALLVAGSTADTYVYQDETVTEGEVYRLIFYTRSYAGDTSLGRYQVWDLTNSANIIATTTVTGVAGDAATWYETSVEFTVPSACVSVRILFRSPSVNTDRTYFDYATLTQGVPISTEHNQMSYGDVVYAESNGKVEFFWVMGGPEGSGPYTYYVWRDLDGSGTNLWHPGDALFNTGDIGKGFIDIYSYSGITSGTVGPAIVGNVRNSSTYNDWSEHWAVGNLEGLYGYATETYGAAFGEYASGIPWIGMDSTNGIRIMNYTTNVAQWDISGNIRIGNVATENIYITSTGIQLRNGTDVNVDLTDSTLTLGTTSSGTFMTVSSTGIEQYYGSTSVISISTSGVRLGSASTAHINTSATYGLQIFDASSNVAAVFGAPTGNFITQPLYVDDSVSYTGRIKGYNDNYAGGIYGDGLFSFVNTYAAGTNYGLRFLNYTTEAVEAEIIVKDNSGGDPDMTLTTSGDVVIYGDRIELRPTSLAYTYGAAYFQDDVRIGSGLSVGDLSYSPADGEIYATGNSTNESGKLTLRSYSTDGSVRPNITIANNNLLVVEGDDHADQYFDFYSNYAGTRSYSAYIRVYGASSALTEYVRLGHSGTYAQLYTPTGPILLNTSSNELTKIQNSNGYVTIGAANSVLIYFNTDRSGYSFDKYVSFGQGIYVGSTAGTGVDNSVIYEGSLYSRKSSTNYEVFGAHYFTSPLTNTAWDGDDAKSTGTHTITRTDFTNGSSETWPANAKAVLVRIGGYFGATSSSYSMSVRPKSTAVYPVGIRGIVANLLMENIGWVPCDSNGDIDVLVSGASVGNAWLQVFGYSI